MPAITLDALLRNYGSPPGSAEDGWPIPCPIDSKHSGMVFAFEVDGDWTVEAACFSGCPGSDVLDALAPDGITYSPTASPDGEIVWADRWEEALSDVTRARLSLDFIRGTGRDVRWNAGTGFYLYEDGVWKKDAETEIRSLLTALGDNIAPVAQKAFAKVSDAESKSAMSEAMREAKAIAEAAVKARSLGAITASLEVMKTLPGILTDADAFDADPFLLPVENGAVDLRTGEIRPLRREDLVTYRIPIAFDPEAEAPRWERFLSEVFVDADGATDPELVDFARKLVGYGITGSTQEQILAICYGGGSNGKSVFLDVLGEIFGPIKRTTDFETFASSRRGGGAPTPELAQLAGARLVFAGESEDTTRLAEGRVKSLTGDRKISARALHKMPFEFTPRFLILLATNHKPSIRGTDEGIWRRIRLVPFRRYFRTEERDRTLIPTLLAEAPGILAWAVRGAVEWYANGLGEPAAVAEETKEYRAEEDRLSEFLGLYLEIGKGAGTETLSDLFRAYKAWAEDAGEAYPLGRKSFAANLAARPDVVKRRDGSNVTVFSGVRILADGETRARKNRLAVLRGAEEEKAV